MGQIKNIKLHIVTDIKNVSKKSFNMPWRKIVAQIAMEVGKIAGRAMTDALRKEFNQGAQKAARASAAGAKKAVEDQKIGGMSVEEAKMILNVQELVQTRLRNSTSICS